jgi:hypothetical protein
MYIAKLVCWVPGPLRSVEGPAINPAKSDPTLLFWSNKSIELHIIQQKNGASQR